MAHYKNHLIDPHYFYDAIEEFAFDYDIYVQVAETTDEFFKKKYIYEKHTIRGSLQSQGRSLQQNKAGNTMTESFKFYCKSLYRINIGDFIFYDNSWLYCNGISANDEWGVREADLTMVQLNAYIDLAEYVKYINGEKIV